jgi:hypothetical protein
MKKFCLKCQVSIVVVLCLGQFLYAQWVPVHKTTAVAVASVGSPPETLQNGITVDCPKVFDNRTLTLMLETLSESLRKVQFIDQQTLASALQLIQGFQTKEVATNLSIGTRPTPKITQSQKTNTGNVSDSGAALPDTTETSTGTERASETPQPPALDTLPAFSGFTPNYGENAADLLSDQVNLTYRIFNLRMLLERSLSDRLLSNSKPRRQAVLGFNVTVDPPRTAEDAVAVVEITLNLTDPNTSNSSQAANANGLSLVSMMPEEKTYNAAALSTKSNAFGGAAIVKMINVGYSERRRGQTFYLYRDADTIAYQRMNEGNPNQVVFGWMFRPVLGRRSVSPGLRQLFAIVALPKDDSEAADISQYLNASVRTYWRKYDRDTMTSFEAKEANRFTRFRYALSLNLSKPEIFDSRYENRATYNGVEIKPTNHYQNSLRPTVSGVTWRPIGGKSIIISATGENFFSETKVAIGDKIYSTTADGLILKSNQSFDLTTTIDALVNGNGTIIGRYSTSVPLIAKEDRIARNELIVPGKIRISETRVDPTMAGHRLLTIHLRDHVPILTPDYLRTNFALPAVPDPIITINGKPVPLPYVTADKVITETVNNAPVNIPEKEIQCNVPESFFNNGGGILKVAYVFLPDNWTATWLITNPDADFDITRISKQNIVLSTRGPLGFTINPYATNPNAPVCWTLFIGGKRYVLNSPVCTVGVSGTEGLSTHTISADLSAQKIDIPDKIILISPWGAVSTLEVPKSPAPEPAEPKPLTVGLNDQIFVDVPVSEASAVGSVEAAQQKLYIIVPEPEKENEVIKKIKVYTDKITGKQGNVDLTIFDKKGKLLKIVTLQVVCKNCRNKGEK